MVNAPAQIGRLGRARLQVSAPAARALPDDGVAHHLRQLLADPAVMRWIEAAKADPRRLSRCDVG